MQKTLENLTKAFIWESQARNRYDIYAKIAKKEWYEQISDIFKITADNERVHAKNLFRMIQELKKDESDIVVEAGACTTHWDTIENLKSAIAGESYENTTMYPEFAQIAREEWLEVVAIKLESIGKAEVHHEERFKNLLKALEDGTIFKKSDDTVWLCRECGYIHIGPTPPEKCPSCDHPHNYFQVKCETY